MNPVLIQKGLGIPERSCARSGAIGKKLLMRGTGVVPQALESADAIETVKSGNYFLISK